jgi:HK97 family phage major capsid protein
MKEKLQALLAKKEARKADLAKKNEAAQTVEELRGITAEIEAVQAEIRELQDAIAEIPEETEQRGAAPIGKQAVLGTYGVATKEPEQRCEDKHDTTEYRKAFMDFVLRGVKSDVLEYRADAVTHTTDIGAVIPTTILNRIVEKMREYGRIYARISKSTVSAGLQIPVASIKPTATWLTEGSVAGKQKKSTSGVISFNYYKLQIRVAVTLEADLVALPVFEDTVSGNINEAMIVAIEEAIINGSGVGQPLGITKDTDIPAGQIAELTADEFGAYATWPELYAKLPRTYRNGSVLILNDADWNKYIVGMVDKNDQPVARVTSGLDGIQDERLLGKEVLAVEDYLPSIDDAAPGDVIGIICNLSDYYLNSNMQLTFRRYFDEDTDENISKCTLVADGKLADKNGVVLIKKSA